MHNGLSLYSFIVRAKTISLGQCFLNFVIGEEFAQRTDLTVKAEITYKKKNCASLKR